MNAITEKWGGLRRRPIKINERLTACSVVFICWIQIEKRAIKIAAMANEMMCMWNEWHFGDNNWLIACNAAV